MASLSKSDTRASSRPSSSAHAANRSESMLATRSHNRPGGSSAANMPAYLFGGVTVETVQTLVPLAVVAPSDVNDAVIVAVPVPLSTAVTSPVALTVATVGSELVHVAVAVASYVLPSARVAVAASCCVAPIVESVNGLGETAIDVTAGPLVTRSRRMARFPVDSSAAESVQMAT